MKIKVVYNHHYKKCKKERTKAKKAAKWFAKIRATNDKVVYKSAEIFVWPNSSIIFLDYGHQTDIMTLGKALVRRIITIFKYFIYYHLLHKMCWLLHNKYWCAHSFITTFLVIGSRFRLRQLFHLYLNLLRNLLYMIHR